MSKPKCQKSRFSIFVLPLLAVIMSVGTAQEPPVTQPAERWNVHPTLAGRKRALEDFDALRCHDHRAPSPIVKIVIRMKKPPAETPNEANYRRFVTWQTSESTDRRLCELTTEALRSVMVKFPKREPQVFAWQPYGELEIQMATKSVRLLLGESFAIDNDEPCNSNTALVSLRLADVVQETLAANQHAKLSDERFEMLSGAAWRKAERAAYELDLKPRDPAPQDAVKPDTNQVKAQKKKKPAREPWSLAKLEGKGWDKLDLGPNEPIESFVIRLKRLARNGSFSYSGFEVWFEREVKDPVLLQRVNRSFRDAIKQAPSCGFGGSGSMAIGEVEFRTKQRTFVVYLDFVFLIVGPYPNDKNSFRSWTLAKVVDQVIREGTGQGFDPKRFRSASAENLDY